MALNAPGGPSADFDPNDPVCREIAEGRSLDVREIDGASNRGVDQVRELRDDVRFMPQYGKYKIYIIDEVHMLTKEAFNALLKTLEEPPPHVKFIFATTEVDKVLPTILSRCQRFDLKRLSNRVITSQLSTIAQAEGFQIAPAALESLARLADGGMRDAQSSLDQLVAFCGKNISEQDVLQIFGLPSRDTVAKLATCLLGGDTAGAWSLSAACDHEGKDIPRLLSDLLAHLRSVLMLQKAPALVEEEATPDAIALLAPQKDILPPGKVLRMIELLSSAESRIRYSLSPKIIFDVALASACEIPTEVELNDILLALDHAPSHDRKQAPPATAHPTRTETQPEKPVATATKVAAPAPQPPTPIQAPPEPPVNTSASSTKEQPVVKATEVSQPTPQPAAPTPQPTISAVDPLAEWELITQKAPPLYRSQILSATLSGTTLTVEVNRSGLQLMSSGLSSQLTSSFLKAVPGYQIELVPVDYMPEPETTQPNSPTAEPSAPKKMKEEDFKNDPYIQEALQLFRGRISKISPA